MGRSGSTLVQGALNGLPSTLIRGESNFFVFYCFSAYRAIASAHESFGQWPHSSSSERGPWFGADALRPSSALDDMRSLVRRQLVGGPSHRLARQAPRTIGFKEIRWTALEPGTGDAPGFVGFCQAVFGHVGWVLHTRDLHEIRRSGWWAGNPGREVARTFEHVLEVQAEVRGLVKPSQVFESTYRELTTQSGDWASRLASWAGHSANPGLAEQITSILSLPHGYRTDSV